jgi:ribosome-associated translation inhibitor RaiA
MTLKWNLVTKGMRPHQQMRDKLQQKVDKLQTHLEHFPPDAVHLQVFLQRQPRGTGFLASLTLRLPSNILHAEKAGPDPVPAFDASVKALLREINVLKSSLRRESDWNRTERGAEIPGVPPLPVAPIAAAVM